MDQTPRTLGSFGRSQILFEARGDETITRGLNHLYLTMVPEPVSSVGEENSFQAAMATNEVMAESNNSTSQGMSSEPMVLEAACSNEGLGSAPALAEKSSIPTVLSSEAKVCKSLSSVGKEHPSLILMTTVISQNLDPIAHLKVCGNKIPLVLWRESLYLPLQKCLSAMDLANYLANRGHTAIRQTLESFGYINKDVFLLLLPSLDGKGSGRWISRKCFMALLRYEHIFLKRKHRKTLFLNLLKNVKISGNPSDSVARSMPSQLVQNNVPERVSTSYTGTAVIPLTGNINVRGQSSSYVVLEGNIYLEINTFPKLREHINVRGYRFIDKVLDEKKIDPELSFITTYHHFKRSHICSSALLVVLENCCLVSKDDRNAMKILRDDIKDAIILNLVHQMLVEPINGSRKVQNKKRLTRFVCEEIG